MTISEAQFKKMLRGTVHEGKYGTQQQQTQPAAPTPAPPKRTAPKRRSEAEHLAGIANRVLPWHVGFKVFFNPVTWFVLAFAIGVAASFLMPILNIIFSAIEFIIGLADSPAFLILFLIQFILIVCTILHLRK